MPGFRRDRSLQVQDQTRTMSATASSHAHPSLQDHHSSNSSAPRARPVSSQYTHSSYPRPSILTARPLCTPPSFRASPRPSAAPFRWCLVIVVWGVGLTRVGGGQKVAYGFDGVYFQDLREPNREPIKVLALTDVAQVDVLNDYGLLIVLSGVVACLLSISHRRLTSLQRVR
jgi:hypothetical protein